MILLIGMVTLVSPYLWSQGVFANPELQDIYNNLLKDAGLSLVHALKIGLTIEELDINDFQEAINQTDNTDIKVLYQNLMKGSRNHLRTYYQILTTENGTYQPQFLNSDDCESIANSPLERGFYDENGQPLLLTARKFSFPEATILAMVMDAANVEKGAVAVGDAAVDTESNNISRGEDFLSPAGLSQFCHRSFFPNCRHHIIF